MRFEPAGDRAARTPAALTAFLAKLQREAVSWSLLRPPASLTSPEGDVDVLLAPEAIGVGELALQEAGFVLVPMPGPDVHGSLFDAELGRFVWVHLQGTLDLAGAEMSAGVVLAHTEERDGVRVPRDEWLLWILLLRALVDKGELAERHRATVEKLARRWQGGPPELVGLVRLHGIDPEAAVSAAADADWPNLMRHSVHRPAPPPSGLRRWLGHIGRLRRLRELYARRGISVAVIGPDGAGKSGLVASLARDLPLPVRIQYMGLTGGQLPRADALRVPGVVFVARMAIIWLRYLRGVRQMMGGGIVVFDRYTLDGMVAPGMRLSPLGRMSRRIQVHVCPLPDLVLLLDASGETLHARSGEYSADTLESWRRAFARLEAEVGVLEKLDAERPLDQVRYDAEARVWRRYGELRGRAPVHRP